MRGENMGERRQPVGSPEGGGVSFKELSIKSVRSTWVIPAV